MGNACSRRKYDIEVPHINEENLAIKKEHGLFGYQECSTSYDSGGTSCYLPCTYEKGVQNRYREDILAIEEVKLKSSANTCSIGYQECSRNCDSGGTHPYLCLDESVEKVLNFTDKEPCTYEKGVLNRYREDILAVEEVKRKFSANSRECIHSDYLPLPPGSCETYPVSISSGYQSVFRRSLEEASSSESLCFQGECIEEDCLSALHSATLKFKEKYPEVEQIWKALNLCSAEKELVICIYNENNVTITENSIDDFRIISNTSLKNAEEKISETINRTYQTIKFKSEKICAIKHAIKEHSQTLFKCHVNLSAISACPFKIEGRKLIQKWCIVLYCCCKGYIPLGEKEFPSSLQGIPVDVREGVFSFSSVHKSNDGLLTSDDVNPLMAIGKEITIEKTRLSCTAGTFVTFKHNGETVKGILTCAHVAFSKEELVQNVDLPCRNLHVIDKHTLTRIGEVCEVRFQPSQKVSIDATLVKIDEAFLPQYGQFVKDKNNLLKKIGFSEISPPCFCNAQEVRKDESGNYKTTSVFKFGASSGLTLGDINFDEAVCRTSNLGFSPMDKDPVVLNGQLHIFPRHQFCQDFFTQGDSGAIVFQKNGEEIGAVGLAIGKINSACVVTGFRSILNAFKYADMKLLKFQCDLDSGVSMSGPSTPAFSESLLTKFSNIRISSEGSPPQRKRKPKRSTDHEPIPNNTITVQTRSGLSIEARNSQLKWQRGQEYFTITSPVPPSNSRLSIRTPDATNIHSVHNGEFELQTETETLRVIHCN